MECGARPRFDSIVAAVPSKFGEFSASRSSPKRVPAPHSMLHQYDTSTGNQVVPTPVSLRPCL